MTFEAAVTAAREAKAAIAALEAMKSTLEETIAAARANLAAAEEAAAERLKEISESLEAERKTLQGALQAINDAPLSPAPAPEDFPKAAHPEEMGTVATEAEFPRTYGEGETFAN